MKAAITVGKCTYVYMAEANQIVVLMLWKIRDVKNSENNENTREKAYPEGLRAIRTEFLKLYLYCYRQMLNRDGKIANDT